MLDSPSVLNLSKIVSFQGNHSSFFSHLYIISLSYIITAARNFMNIDLVGAEVSRFSRTICTGRGAAAPGGGSCSAQGRSPVTQSAGCWQVGGDSAGPPVLTTCCVGSTLVLPGPTCPSTCLLSLNSDVLSAHSSSRLLHHSS